MAGRFFLIPKMEEVVVSFVLTRSPFSTKNSVPAVPPKCGSLLRLCRDTVALRRADAVWRAGEGLRKCMEIAKWY